MQEKATKILGMPGALISGSKSGYCERNPQNLPVFNSNVIAVTSQSGLFRTSILEKIWFGDIDVTKSIDKLESLAKSLETDIYVLREMDARFENEKNPQISKFVIKVTPGGERTLGNFEKEYYDTNTLLRKE